MEDLMKVFDQYAAGYNHLNVDKVMNLFNEDAVFKDPRFPPFQGKDAIREFFRSEYAKIEKGTYKVTKLFTCIHGNRMTVEWNLTVTIKETKESASLSGVSLIELRDGRILGITEYYDTKSYSY